MLEIECDTWAKNHLAYLFNSDVIQSTKIDSDASKAKLAEAEKQVAAAKFNCDETMKRIEWIESFIKTAK